MTCVRDIAKRSGMLAAAEYLRVRNLFSGQFPMMIGLKSIIYTLRSATTHAMSESLMSKLFWLSNLNDEVDCSGENMVPLKANESINK